MKYLKIGLTMLITFVLVACGAETEESSVGGERPEDAPETWIADRTITGLVFQSAGDAGVDTMSPEIADYIKERTGITLELQTVTSEDSTEALAAGLAAGDLPDFVAFYLNNSGRPEFPILLQASNQGMFHDIAPYLQEGETYGKYFEEGYLPTDTRENIMMREEHDGATYLVHMAIDEEPADPGIKSVGGPYVRRDIVEDLGIDPLEINTSEQVYDLLAQIAEGDYTDNNGNPVTPLGPTVWGGSERPFIYNDLVWQGDGGEKFWKDGDEVLHESQTDYAEQRISYVRQLMDEGLMHPEFYTMEETRASEGVTNGSFAIVADMYNYRPEVGDLNYVPLGPINRVDGNNHMVMPYKSGYAGWAVPSTTEAPEHVVQFADWMASEEGKTLYMYGLEGVHYEVGEDGTPVPNEELVQLQDENPDQAIEEGFRGVRAFWGEHLAWTNMNNLDQFGEANWGDKVREEGEDQSVAQRIIEMYNWDERYENKEVIDGLYPRSYLFEFEEEAGPLNTALDRWEEDIIQAYYASSEEEVANILEAARQELQDAGLEEFTDLLEEKEAEGDVIFY
jgi:putative aldouronate transport system substrate-binding protein